MAREICEILITDDEGQHPSCRFILENGVLTGEPIDTNPDSIQGMRRLLASPMFIKNGAVEVSSTEQPALWFHALPNNITGSYVRAKMVT
jgi:hypothetical protein